jgi:hypothetical protein
MFRRQILFAFPPRSAYFPSRIRRFSGQSRRRFPGHFWVRPGDSRKSGNWPGSWTQKRVLGGVMRNFWRVFSGNG